MPQGLGTIRLRVALLRGTDGNNSNLKGQPVKGILAWAIGIPIPIIIILYFFDVF